MTVLGQWRNGKAFNPDPELFRGGTGTMGMILMAWEIERMAHRCCHGPCLCPYYEAKCFMRWYLPELDDQPNRSREEHDRVQACINSFEMRLKGEGFLG